MIEINNTIKFTVDKKLFTGLAKKIIKGENKQIDLSVAFIAKDKMKEINKKYRKKNKATDVLSFESSEGFTNLNSRLSLGEVIICPDIVRENAKKFGNTFKYELIKVFIHGVLHVLGYDHEKSKKEALKMEEREKFYLSKI